MLNRKTVSGHVALARACYDAIVKDTQHLNCQKHCLPPVTVELAIKCRAMADSLIASLEQLERMVPDSTSSKLYEGLIGKTPGKVQDLLANEVHQELLEYLHEVTINS